MQIGVAIADSSAPARYFGRDLFGKWQYAHTLLLLLSPIARVCGAEILLPTIVHRQKNNLAAPLRFGSPRRRRRCCCRGRTFCWHSGGLHPSAPVTANLAGLAVTGAAEQRMRNRLRRDSHRA